MDLLPKVFRTEGNMESFDPSKISNSITKETGMKEKDANHITELVVRRIISSGIRFLSGPHIREIVCSVLSEQHFEQERKLYTRIGMPLMDYEKMLNLESEKIINPEKIHHWAANQLAEEYTLLRILNDEESKAHLYGDIHIHKLKYFDLRPLSQIWDPRIILKNGIPPTSDWAYCCKSGPANNLKAAVHQLTKWLGMMQGEFSGTQGFDFITNFLAPYAKGLSEDEIKEGMQILIYEINQLSAVISRDISNTSISCCPIIINELSELPAICAYGKNIGTYGDYTEECLKLFNAITEIFTKGDYYQNAFTSPKHMIYINKNWLKEFNKDYYEVWNEIIKKKNPYLMNLCSEKLMKKLKEQHYGNGYHNYGTLQNICLNLPRYAYLSNNEDNFMEILRKQINLCSGILNKKYEIIKKRLNSKHLPLCSVIIEDQPLFKFENQKLGLSVVGLNEAIKHLTNYELHEEEDSFNLGKNVIKEISKICEENSKENNKNYTLIENISEKARFRFAKLDLVHFSTIAKPQKNQNIVFYTNSTRFRENIEMDLFEKISKQGEFHHFLSEAVEYISLNKIKSDIKELAELIEKICTESEIIRLKFH